MPTPLFRKPLLPSHYSVWCEPPDESGDEVLHIVSGRRSLKLKGHSFREFYERVVPLLDGRHDLAEIQEQTVDVFRAEDLADSLTMLTQQGVIVEGDMSGLSEDVAARLATQLNFFHDLTPGAAEAQAKLGGATVALVGLGGAGAATALALAAAGIGSLRLIDALPLAVTDVYLTPFFGVEDVGRGRAEVLERKIKASAPQVSVSSVTAAIESEEEVRAAIQGVDFLVCSLDAAQTNLAYKLNRVCLAEKIRWIAGSLAGTEVTVGPVVHPGESACYLCYRMRSVACAGNPEEAFAFEKHLDRRKRDDGGRRENLVFGAGLAANLVGMEVLKELTGFAETSLVGRILTIQLTDLAILRHTVLRKPWCPACFGKPEEVHAS